MRRQSPQSARIAKTRRRPSPGRRAGIGARAGGGAGLKAADVPAVTVPTLYVWGDADRTVGREAAEATRDHVKGPFEFVELQGIGHFITDEAPEAVAGRLLDHVRRAESGD